MAAPTISIALGALRRRIARRFDDNESGTASGGSSTTITMADDLARYDASPSALIGVELAHTNAAATSIQTRHITAHSFASPTTTLTVPAFSSTAPANGDIYELHGLNGRGFTAAQYNDAINASIDSVADAYFTDSDTTLFGYEYGGNQQTSPSFPRREYPVPASLNYIYKIQYLNAPHAASSPIAFTDSVRAFGTTGDVRLAQGFQVQSDGYYEWFVIGVAKVGSPTDNLILSIMPEASPIGKPSGTALTFGSPAITGWAIADNFSGSTLETRVRYAPMHMSPPVYLTTGTQYYWELKRSGIDDDTNYYIVAEDTGNSYGNGTAYTSSSTTYTAVSGSDFAFAVYPASSDWRTLMPKTGWEYRRVGSDSLYIPGTFYDGCPIRVLGATAIAEVTNESTSIPIRPEYAEAYALNYLLSGRAGRAYADNYNQGMVAWAQKILSNPRPTRALPANAVQVFS